jgi:ATP-binding cassette subfamily B protein RaxB
MLRLPVQYYEKRHVGDVVSRVGAVDQIQHTLTTSFLEAVLDGAMTIVIVTMMLVYSPLLSSIALLAMLLYATGRWVGYGPLRNATEEQIVHAAKQQSHLLETIRGVKVIKLFQRQEERRSSWLTLLIDQINADLRTQKLQLLFKTLNGVLFGLENVIILWLGAKLVLDGHFTVGVLLAFVAYKTQFATRVAALIDKGFEIKMLQLYGERLADIVLAEPETGMPAGLAGEGVRLAPTIETRGLRYRYSDSEPYVLNGVNLKIEAGESVAIVGPSGCGKSTLLNVLLGILPPSEGEVLVGGVNMRTLGPDSVRQMVGTVLQDDVLFAGSIAENISFFATTPDREWIAECARMASVSADIEAMPMGYNTMVGDMGTVMSGGQKQRVLLARALYRRPKILLLDEATSHLDVKREQEVNQAIGALQITRIIIAHRPETIASAGRVIELRDGAVIKGPAAQGGVMSTDQALTSIS